MPPVYVPALVDRTARRGSSAQWRAPSGFRGPDAPPTFLRRLSQAVSLRRGSEAPSNRRRSTIAKKFSTATTTGRQAEAQLQIRRRSSAAAVEHPARSAAETRRGTVVALVKEEPLPDNESISSLGASVHTVPEALFDDTYTMASPKVSQNNAFDTVLAPDDPCGAGYPPSAPPTARFPSTSRTPPPFAREISLVLSTFFHPASPKELNLEQRLRLHVLRAAHPDPVDPSLWGTVHPDLFKPVDAAVLRMLESSSLRGFLAWSTSNTNNPKRNFWYLIGSVDLAAGLLVSLLIFAFVRVRWWRFCGWPLICIGSMQLYSAYRNFCSVVHGRGTRQLAPWELLDLPSTMPEPASTAPARMSAPTIHYISPRRTSRGQLKPPDVAQPTTLHIACPFLFDDPAPLDESTLPVPPCPSQPDATSDEEDEGFRRRQARKRSMGRKKSVAHSAVRASVFGPETAVEDPAVVTLQAALIRKILVVGTVAMLLLGGAILALPERG